MLHAMTRDELLKKIERYLAAHEISARAFSVQSTGDSGFVSRLRAGKANVTWRTIERITEYMNKHRIAAE